jgi:hypothetical protein
MNKSQQKLTQEQKAQLFPYFAYLFFSQKYGSFTDEAKAAASKLSDDEWLQLAQSFAEQMQGAESGQTTQMAAKGAKLKELSKYKKGGKKKCACGCDIVLKKEGGKIVEGCSCNCKGGKIK